MPATYQNANRKGKVVVSNDEWTLSTQGFDHAQADATAFTKNLARYFLEGRKTQGSFYMGTTNGYINSPEFRQALLNQGHSLSAEEDSSSWDRTAMNQKLASYDGVIVGGGQIPDTNLLTEFVLRGGCVYLVAGSGTAELPQINDTLNNFGVTINSTVNGLNSNVQNISATADHELFDGVSQLYMLNGYDLQLASPLPNFVGSHVSVPDPQNSGWFLYSIIEVPTVQGAGLVATDMPDWHTYGHHFRWEDGILSVVLAYNLPPSDSGTTWHTDSEDGEVLGVYGTASCRLWAKNMSTVPIYVRRVRMVNDLLFAPGSDDQNRSFYDIYYCDQADQDSSMGHDRKDLFIAHSLNPGDVLDSGEFHWGLQREQNDSSNLSRDLRLTLGALPNYRMDYSSSKGLRDFFPFSMPPVPNS